MSQNTIVVKVTCDSGLTWVTSIQGTIETACAYFYGRRFWMEDEDGNETSHRVTIVKQI
jgi:hypothetical protein